MRIIMATLGVCLSLMLHAADKKLTVVTIPDHNGLGSSFGEISRMFGEVKVNIIPVSTPTLAMDFGQRFCQRYLEEKIPGEGPYIIDATSQGTATAINWLARNPDKTPAALILKAVMASGNSAIHHTLLHGGTRLADDSVHYYVLPYLAKCLPGYLAYWPSGQQALDSIEKIPTNIPIIIGHSKRDPQLPFDGACALYYRLTELGNKNVYLISRERPLHVGVLDDEESRTIVRSILKKHKLLDYKEAIDDLSPYQPNHRQAAVVYNELKEKEDCHKRIGRVLKGLGAAAAIWGLHTLNRIICWQCVQGR